MKMKSLSVISAAFIFAMFLFVPSKAQTPSKGMPITTSSKDALKAFTEGRVDLKTHRQQKLPLCLKKPSTWILILH